MKSLGPTPTLVRRPEHSLSVIPAEVDAYSTAPMPESQTLSGLFRILRRRWKAVCLTTIVTFVLGTIAGLLITPRYAATSTIEINRDSGGGDATAREAATMATADEIKTEVQTDISILQSDGLALSIIRKLDLINKPPFRNAVPKEEKGKPLDQAPRTREKVLMLFAKYLKVDSPQDTRLLTVTFQNPDANVAAQAANSLAEEFIANTSERRHNSIFRASHLLQTQLDSLKKQVKESEQKLADYERETGLAGIQLSGSSASGDGTSSVAISSRNTVTDRLFNLNQELTAAEANRISTEIIYRLLKTQDPEVVLGLGSMNISAGGGSGALAADGGIQLVRALRSQEQALSQEYAAAAVKYGENNPRLTGLHEQLDALKGQMKAELQRVSERAENDYSYAQKNEDAIRHQFTDQQSAANLLADKTVQLQILAQEAYSNQALYENLFSKLQAANLAASVRATRLDVLDVARPPGMPAFPPWGKLLPVLVVVSILFGISAGFLREILDETVRTSRDLGQIADMPLLSYIPSLRMKLEHTGVKQRQSRLIDEPSSIFSEAFRTLRTSITLQTATLSRKLFLVTSPSSGDGKTTVTYNLGVAFAQQGARVLLIDGDLRRPKLHFLFGCKLSPGLADLEIPVSGSKIAGVIQHPDLPKLSMLPAGRLVDFQAEFFGSGVFDSLLDACAQHYDYVLIDSPPMLSVTDASLIATRVTGCIAVVRSRTTTRAVFSAMVEALRRTGTPTIGVLLNDVRRPTLDGFYEYSYASHKSYEPADA
jgi:polysaccharide biosynthesis transport protein